MTVDDWFEKEPERSGDAAAQEGQSPDAASYYKMTPLARRIAAERGIDTGSMKGSGYMGKIFTEDLSNYSSETAPRPERPLAERPPAPPARPVFSIVPPHDEASPFVGAKAAPAQPPARMTYAARNEGYREEPAPPAPAPTPPSRMTYASGQDEYRDGPKAPPPPRMAYTPQFGYAEPPKAPPPERPFYASGQGYGEPPQALPPPEREFLASRQGFEEAPQAPPPPEREFFASRQGYEEPPQAPQPEKELYASRHGYEPPVQAMPPGRPFLASGEYEELPKAPPPERPAIASRHGFGDMEKAPVPERQAFAPGLEYDEPAKAPATPKSTFFPEFVSEYDYEEAKKEAPEASQPWFPEYEYREAPKALPPAKPSYFFEYEKKEEDEDIAGVMRMNEARRLVAAQAAKSSLEAAPVTQHMETDITELVSLYEHVNADREIQDPIPMAAFYIKAMSACVREKDRFRMRLADGNEAFLLIEGAHVGLQVAAGDSLPAPVIRNADQKPLGQIASEILSLTEKAKQGGLTRRDVRGGAITLLDKGGSFVHTFTPIINLPESAILGIGAIYQRLVMTGRSIENRYYVMQSLTYDHRVINGHEADEFQCRLKEILENPRALLG